ncbi:MAG: LysR family transcriptional regulator [Sneathiellales bacterium]|nr:LysR family transcriptional regulator [Sneathiellales bacterium]
MNLKKLRYFLTIVEEGSFTRAASKLNVAQSALSLHIHAMEDEFGHALLIREKRGVKPTEAGLLLFERARRLIADAEKTRQDLLDFGEQPKGTVRIGFPGTVSSVLSEPLIASCRKKFPEIKLVIAEAMSGFVKEWLAKGQVDLALLYLDIQDNMISSSLILEEEIVVVHAFSDKRAEIVSSEELVNYPLILPSQSHGLRVMLDGKVPLLGGSISPVIEVDSFYTIKRLVEKGYGSSLLPLHAVNQEVQEKKLSVSHIEDRHLWRRIYLAERSARTATAASNAVISLLNMEINSLVQSGRWAGARLLQ